MALTIHSNGTRVVLSVLAGADPSLVGLKVGHSTIISMKYQDLYEIALKVYGIGEKGLFIKTLSNYHLLPDSNRVVLETISDTSIGSFYSELIPKALKLYRGADIYSCYNINYRFENNKIRFGGLGDICKGYYHSRGMITQNYKLTIKKQTEASSKSFNFISVLI